MSQATQPPDRHARWSVANLQEAFDQRILKDTASQNVIVDRATLGMFVKSRLGDDQFEDAWAVAGALNRLGALPRAEHEALGG